MIKYDTTLITFTEVPDEISLCLNITGCPCRCQDCFEPWLRKDYGTKVDLALIGKMRQKYPHITCICFMGGDNDHKYLKDLFRDIKIYYPDLKLAMYSGLPTFDIELSEYLDYYKFGPYMPDRGPLNKQTTNQKFCAKIKGRWLDITYKFQNEKV